MKRIALALALAAASALMASAPAHAADTGYDVLVFSKTGGFRHDSIPAGIQAVKDRRIQVVVATP